MQCRFFYHKFVPRNRKTMNVLVYSKAWLCRNVEQNKWNDLVFCHLTKKCILRIDKFDFWIDNCRLEVRTIRNLLVRCHVKFISQNCLRETQKRAYRQKMTVQKRCAMVKIVLNFIRRCHFYWYRCLYIPFVVSVFYCHILFIGLDRCRFFSKL